MTSLAGVGLASAAVRQTIPLDGHLWHVIEAVGFMVAALASVWISELLKRNRAASARGARVGDTPAPGPESAPARTPDYGWLQAAALGLIGAACTHLAVMPDHFQQSWMYGTFFLCAAGAQLLLAGLILARPTRDVLTAGVAGSIAVVALWAISRFVGVPIGPDHGGTEEIGVLDVLATVLELGTAISCSVVLWRGRARPAWRWCLWSAQLRLMLLVTGIVVPVAAAISSRS